jgi:AcrR family transcriptional regulator
MGAVSVQTEAIGGELTSVQRILERTIQVIETAGEAAIRTNPIAFECGVTPPILYRAFGNREGLIIAAQAERYRRSTEAGLLYLFRYIDEANSREQLRENISTSLDFIFSEQRAENRRLRADVIGSSMSRPELREQLTRIDEEYALAIMERYQPAIDKGWLSREKNHAVIAIWAQGVVNARVMVDKGASAETLTAWDELSKRAILSAIFD